MSNFNSIGLSGMFAASKGLTGVSNNIANAETTGFKRAMTSISNLANGSYGAGAFVSGVMNDFSQGSREASGRALDMMVSGDGMFVVSSESSLQNMYTRNGSFSVDANGFLVTQDNYRVQGYAKDASGQYPLSLSDIVIPLTSGTPEITQNAAFDINLQAGGTFFSTSTSVYDSMGAMNRMDTVFTPTGVNSWDVNYSVDGSNYGPFAVAFDGAGQIIGAPVHAINIPGFSNGANPQVVQVDLTAITQYDGSNKITSITSDGYGVGSFESVEFTPSGIVSVRYSNGQTVNDFQVALAKFPNMDGVVDVGNSKYVDGFEAGSRNLGFPGEDGFGSVNSNALESSNVDLTQELVDLISYQKHFKASSKVVTTSSQLTDTVLNLDR